MESADFPESALAARSTPGKFPQGPRKSARLRVLIVDDEPLIRWSLTEALVDRGYEAASVGDARSATRACAAEPFDVVLLDLRLSDSTGLGLLARLLAIAPEARFILMTAFGTEETCERALRLGAVDVVHKPFEIGDMLRLVAAADRTPLC
jgi:DNA-binding NtrC family response regulator